MKNFLKRVQNEIQKDLFGIIEKNELPISSVNGAMFKEGKVSYEEAQEITKNYVAYKKESRRYSSDTTKVVISKRVFLKLLESQVSNLFLLEHLHEGSTRLLLGRDNEDSLFKAIREREYDGIITVIFLSVAIFMISASLFLSGDESLFFKLGMIVLGFVILRRLDVGTKRSNMFSFKKKRKLARDRVSKFKSEDLFFAGCDKKPDESMNLFKGRRWVNFDFANTLDFSNLANWAIQEGGSIGFLLGKGPIECNPEEDDSFIVGDTVEWEVNFKNFNFHIQYLKIPVPVVILTETLIFDVAYLDFIQSKIDESKWEEFVHSDKFFKLLA